MVKLCYHKLPKGNQNFGDDLNPWLWQKLIPDLLNQDEDIALVGIGTLINQGLSWRTRNAKRKIIFGTGVGYGKKISQLDESYKVYCLRGLLSAQALGLDENLAVTDGAVLIRKVFTNTAKKNYSFAYMPHYELANQEWEIACQNMGFGYIDPRWNTEQVLASICSTEVLLTEAMHGAIIADALRIPWIPIITNPTILHFKWQDWCSSINIEFQPHYVPRLHSPKSQTDWLTPIRFVRDKLRRNSSSQALKKIALNQTPFLSKDSRIETLTHQLEAKLEQMKQDIQRGIFNTEN